MSEVKSFWCHEASNILCVRASDFDNVTRLFLDAAERAVASERREKELQQRLTAADERADQQSWALLEVEAACNLAMSVMDADERCANFVQIISAIKAKAALKPAEGAHDFRMIGTAKMPPMEYDEP
jgi:hypothetical protein